VYVLPTTTKPPADILELFKTDDGGRRFMTSYTNIHGDTLKEKPHTLEEYAIEHFRPPAKRTISKALTLSSARRAGKDELWRHSREPIRQPLLKKLQNKEGLVEDASFIFTSILKYMGDVPHKRSKIGNELTDQIFDSPLKQVRN
jgi:myosin-7